MRPHIASCVDIQEHPGGEIAITYQCCGNPRTASTINFPLVAVTDDAEIELRRQVFAANVEARHESAVAVMKQLAQKQQHVETKDQQGSTHLVAIHRVEHWTDEIIRVHYHCCSDPEHSHIEHIEAVQQHTPDEIDSHIAAHAETAANRHWATSKDRKAKIRTAVQAERAEGEGLAKKSL